MKRGHKGRLEDLCKANNLQRIGEYPNQIRLIIKEPSYLKRGNIDCFKCPDLFLGYYNSNWTLIELKHSWKKREQAYIQIESGKKLLVDVFGVPLRNITGKFVIYTSNKFYWKPIHL